MFYETLKSIKSLITKCLRRKKSSKVVALKNNSAISPEKTSVTFEDTQQPMFRQREFLRARDSSVTFESNVSMIDEKPVRF
mmetsp:Transcript_26926/g.20141  ORF Transcript_26926/g.20141 Transcript_26926/m.20141 type:complete len:81 (-) Transcript_26926:42-284(-)